MKRDTLANNLSLDPFYVARLSHRLASKQDLIAPLDSSLALHRLGGYKSAVLLGRVGNSAWGRSMRAKQIIAARWKKERAKKANGEL